MDKRLAILCALLVPLGLATKLYAGPGEYWIHAYAGGALYVMFWALLPLTIWPRLSVRWVIATVLIITVILECLQLWQPMPLQTVRASFLGRALIGSVFDWGDFISYLIGAWLAFICAGRCKDANN